VDDDAVDALCAAESVAAALGIVPPPPLSPLIGCVPLSWHPLSNRKPELLGLAPPPPPPSETQDEQGKDPDRLGAPATAVESGMS